MAIILKANKVNLFVSSVVFVFWYHSPNVLDTPHIYDISRLRVNYDKGDLSSTTILKLTISNVLFLGGRRGTRAPKHFVNPTGESKKKFKMLEFPLNHLQTYCGYLCDFCPLTAFIFSDLYNKMTNFLVKLRVPLNIFWKKKH
jgi:hypothetical protein